MVGYFDQVGGGIRYDLHLINSEGSGECDPLEKELDIVSEDIKDIGTIYVPLPFTTHEMTISRFTLNLDDENCN